MLNTDLNRSCWIAAAVTGLLVWLFTAGFGDLTIFGGLVLGLIAFVLFGLLLVWITAGGGQYADDLGGDDAWQKPSLMAQPVIADENAGHAEPADKMQVSSNGDAQVYRSDSERPASTRYDIYGKKSAEGAEPKKFGQKTGVAPTENDDTATSDDLKEIKGVGQKLEEFLLENGVTRFAQIAEWSEADIDHFAELIGRAGGRIRSDDWIGQARILAAGGETEFSRRVEKGDIYT